MKILSRYLSALTILASSSLCLAQDGQKVDLSAKFLVGKRYVLEQKLEQTTEMQVPGGGDAQEMTVDMTMQMAMAVEREKENEIKVGLSFEKMIMETNMMGQTMKMDATDPAQKATMGAVLDMKPTMYYTDDFQFLRMEDFGLEDNPIAQQMMKEDTLKQMVNGSLEAMPKEPVAPGHQWSYELAMPMEGIGEVSVASDYTFEKMEEVDGVPCALISYTGTIDGDITLPDGQGKITFGDSEFTGTFHFDPAIGYLRKSEAKNVISMNMQIAGQPEMTVPTVQTQTLKLKALEDL